MCLATRQDRLSGGQGADRIVAARTRQGTARKTKGRAGGAGKPPRDKREASKPRFERPSGAGTKQQAGEPAQPTPERSAATGSLQSNPPLAMLGGALPIGDAPVILEIGMEDGYRLVDSGNGLKLEDYGPVRVVRPEAQALWPASIPHAWDKADAVFTGGQDEEGAGRWAFPGQHPGESWPMQLLGTGFFGRLTAFRHVGVFPEQIAHWRAMEEAIVARGERKGGKPRVLNLFGYTGVATLIAARAGAEVTHVDASKKAIGWARENQALAGLEQAPIRWITDDALKFVEREGRRGSSYDIILADPPKFGRGPGGEVWQLFDQLPRLLAGCRAILSQRPLMFVLTAYSIRASFYATHELMRETMRGAGGRVESGELILRETGEGSAGRALSTSLFSRWLPA